MIKYKWCSACEILKPVDDFCDNKSQSDGKHNYCKECHNEQGRISYHKGNGRAHKNKHLKRKYNITLAEYDAMLAEQKGVCEICGMPEKNRSLAVDHDHNTGEIRGLLCMTCNTILGRIERNPNWIPNILRYLKTAELE